jgi:hypothetical protein
MTKAAKLGACGDNNAATESFFALLQKNVLDRRYWHTRDELHHHRHLDRTHLPPPQAPTRPRQTDPDRV